MRMCSKKRLKARLEKFLYVYVVDVELNVPFVDIAARYEAVADVGGHLLLLGRAVLHLDLCVRVCVSSCSVVDVRMCLVLVCF